jgi:hypothetical protein
MDLVREMVAVNSHNADRTPSSMSSQLRRFWVVSDGRNHVVSPDLFCSAVWDHLQEFRRVGVMAGLSYRCAKRAL